MKKNSKRKILKGIISFVFIALVIVLVWKHNSEKIPIQFKVESVDKFILYGGNTKEISEESIIRELKSYYDKIKVTEKMDTFIGEPGTPDFGMKITLKNGDQIDIGYYGYLYVIRTKKTANGYEGERYGYICEQDDLKEFISSLYQ